MRESDDSSSVYSNGKYVLLGFQRQEEAKLSFEAF